MKEMRIIKIKNGYLSEDKENMVFYDTLADLINALIIKSLDLSGRIDPINMKNLRLYSVNFRGEDDMYFQFRAGEII